MGCYLLLLFFLACSCCFPVHPCRYLPAVCCASASQLGARSVPQCWASKAELWASISWGHSHKPCCSEVTVPPGSPHNTKTLQLFPSETGGNSASSKRRAHSSSWMTRRLLTVRPARRVQLPGERRDLCSVPTRCDTRETQVRQMWGTRAAEMLCHGISCSVQNPFQRPLHSSNNLGKNNYHLDKYNV